MPKENNGSRPDSLSAGATASDEAYKVGPGRPPKEYQFKPGVSGNPKGAKRKAPPIAVDLKVVLERALDNKVQLKQGDRARTVSMAVAGIEQLVAQYAKGDHRARRDLFALADKLGVDLLASQTKTIEEALAANHEAILEAYVHRQYDKVWQRPPVLAPAELLDDDTDDQKGS